jgi:hypothetical protein
VGEGAVAVMETEPPVQGGDLPGGASFWSFLSAAPA